MSGLSQWIVLAIGLAASLAWKGYLKWPFPPARPASPPTPGPAIPPAGHPAEGLTSQQLGVLFAQAVRREAEADLAERFAARTREELKAHFSVPFSGEPPAPPGPSGDA